MATKKAPAKKAAVKRSPALKASRKLAPLTTAARPIAAPAPAATEPRHSDTLPPPETAQVDDDDKGGIDSVRLLPPVT